MTRYDRFKLLTAVRDEYILEAMPDYLRGGRVKRRKIDSPLVRFMNSGWGVAAVCVLVAASVMSGILWAGRQPEPPITTPEETEETSEAIDPTTESDPDTTEAPTDPRFEEETDPVILPPDIATKDYGREFHIIYAPTNKTNEDIWLDNSSSNGIDPMHYESIKQTENQLGLHINLISYDPINIDQIYRDTLSLSEQFDLFLLDTPASLGLTIQGHLLPFNNLETINLDAAYWDKSLMDELSLNGKSYLGQNSFLPEDYYLLGYNKTLMSFLTFPWGDEKFDAYETIMSRQWTYDRFLSILSLTENTSDEQGMRYIGLSMNKNEHHHLLLEGSDICIAEKNEEGKYVYTFPDHKDDITELYEAAQALIDADYVIAWTPQNSTPFPTQDDTAVRLHRGDVLFQLLNVTELAEARDNGFSITEVNNIDLGVMPLPLYDTTRTEYTAHRSGVFFSLPAHAPDLTATSEVLELLAYYGSENKTAYYTEMLGKTPEEAPEDHKILRMLSRHMTAHLWEAYIGLYGDFYNEKQDSAFWNIRGNYYRRTFEHMIEQLGTE